MAHQDTKQRKTALAADVPTGVRARSFAGTNLDIRDEGVEREVLARADPDFERSAPTRRF
jgi:hypothetical protein